MKTFILGLFLTLAFSLQTFSYPSTPNPEWAEGALCTRKNSDYTEDRYKEKIPYCERNVSSSMKKEIYKQYNIPEACRNRYTIDHIIPLSIGGDNSPENLWPEHKKVKATRPHLEMDLYEELKAGKIKQKEAIEIVLHEKFKDTPLSANTPKCD